jgi:PAS domain S-box-containing protein
MDLTLAKFQNLISQAPVLITIFRGPTFIIESVNKTAMEAWGKSYEELINKPLFEVSPERENELKAIFSTIYTTGEPFIKNEIAFQLNRPGKEEIAYFNLLYQPLRDLENTIFGIMLIGTEVTEAVNARKQIEASEIRFSNILSQSLLAIAILKGPEMIVTSANETIIAIWGKGKNVIGKPLIEVLPEIKDQVFPQLLMDVYNTGIHFVTNEIKCILNRNGKEEECYFNLVYQPYLDVDETITGITLLATEITEYVLAKKQIEEKEAFNRSIIDSSPDCLKILDFEGRIQYMNSSAICLMEIDDFSTVKNTYWSTLWGNENEAVVKASVDQARKGEVAHFTASCPTAKGTQKWWDVIVSPIGNRGEPVQQIISVSRDISSQKETEEKIRQSEEMFKSIFDNSLAAVLVADDQGNYLSANKAAGELLGYSVQELLQMNVADLKTTVQPGAAKRFEEYIRKSQETGEFDFITKNGTHKFAQYQASRIKADFNLSILMDITEQRVAEQKIRKNEEQLLKSKARLETGLNVANIALAEIDYTTNMVTLSPEAATIYGMPLHNLTVTRRQLHDTFHPNCKEQLEKFIEQAMNPEFKGIMEVEHTIQLPNGEERWVKANKLVYFDRTVQPAKPLYGILAAQDITDRKSYTEKLLFAVNKAESSKEIAENAVMAKQQFLSNMSHEIRTPMNAIVGFTKVLMKTDLSEKQKEYLGAIQSSGDTLIVLIDDILDLAKVDAGKMIFTNAPFKILQSITTILHLFENKIEEKHLELKKEFDSRIPEIVLGDAVRLHQILINLLGNAIKFTSIGKIKVCVNLLKEDKQKVKIEIEVSDTGIGIPQNKIATIFENFEQAHTITSSLYGGTGLGLAIVKQLVEKQGGTIAVKSKVNEGTTFSFILSFQKNRANPDSLPEEVEAVEFDNEIKPLKVLVVEDVKLNQLLLQTILDDFKFEYDIADNGQIAVEKLETNSYDIILMDLQMPIMNGFEATKHIRNTLNLQTPIIALTADVTTVDLGKCKALGMNDYITKPLDEKLLHSKILDLIQST